MNSSILNPPTPFFKGGKDKYFLRNISYLIFIFTFYQVLLPQEDYRKYFGDDYYDALNFVKENNNLIINKLNEYKAEPEILLPVVFPELIRYSLFRDKIETMGLKIFYTELGSKYANFSIGRFQMKPFFAESVEIYLKKNNINDLYKTVKYSTKDYKEIRRIRVRRLEKIEWQLKYLACFYHIVIHKFGVHIKKYDMKDSIRFFSTVYNTGFSKSFNAILRTINLKYFPYGAGRSKNQFCYSDIAVDYYIKCQLVK